MNLVQLRDNFESIFEALKETLRNAFDPTVKQESWAKGETHGINRWQQGYTIDEILKELSLLRSILIGQGFEFLELNPDVGGAAAIYASTTIHRFLDDTMRASVARYLQQNQSDPGEVSP